MNHIKRRYFVERPAVFFFYDRRIFFRVKRVVFFACGSGVRVHFFKFLPPVLLVECCCFKNCRFFLTGKFFYDFSGKNITAVCCAAYRFVCFGTVIVKACAGLAVAYVFKFVYEKLCFLRGDFSVKCIKCLAVCARNKRYVINAFHPSFYFNGIKSGVFHILKVFYHSNVLA